VDFDTWLVEQVTLAGSRRAVERYDVHSLVLPAIPFGPTPEHRNYGSGYIDIPKELHEALVYEVLVSLAEQGFRRILVWRGCGQHDLMETVERFNKAYSGRARAWLPSLPYNGIWHDLGYGSVPGGHADSFATSLALYLRPESVRKDAISNPPQKPMDWDDPDLDFTRYSPTGVIGDPTHASAELGERLWTPVVEAVASTLKTIAEA
jgi:creatinine amidohydrolase